MELHPMKVHKNPTVIPWRIITIALMSITAFLHGSEWAATGKVAQKIQADFPSAGQTASSPFKAAIAG